MTQNIVSLQEISKDQKIQMLQEKLRQYELEEELDRLREQIGLLMKNQLEVYFTALAEENAERSKQMLEEFIEKMKQFDYGD